MRKSALVLGLASSLGLFSGGVTAAVAAEKSAIVVYSTEEVTEEFAKLYMADHPDVEIQIVAGSSGEADARVSAEKDHPQGDISMSGTDPQLANPNLYRKTAGVIDMTNVDKRLNAGDYAIPIDTYPVIFAYNQAQLGEDAAPKTWAELADPKWKGRLYMGNPASSGAAYKALISMWSIGGWELVEKVAANAVITEGSTDPLRALGNAEAAIGIGVENQVYKWADGKSVVAVYPSDGIILHVGNWYLINNSPNPSGAADFVQWMLSPKMQSHKVATYKGMRPAITNASEPAGVPSLAELRIIPYPPEATTGRAKFVERWKDIITSVQ